MKKALLLFICCIMLTSCGKKPVIPDETINDSSNENVVQSDANEMGEKTGDEAEVFGEIEDNSVHDLEYGIINIEENTYDLGLPNDAILLSDSDDKLFYLVYETIDGVIASEFYEFDKNSGENEQIYVVNGNFGVDFAEVYNGELIVSEWDDTARITLVDRSGAKTLYEYESTYYPIVTRVDNFLLIEDFVLESDTEGNQKVISLNLDDNSINVVDEQRYVATSSEISGILINNSIRGLNGGVVLEYTTYTKEGDKGVYLCAYDLKKQELTKLPIEVDDRLFTVVGNEDYVFTSRTEASAEDNRVGHFYIKTGDSYKKYAVPCVDLSKEIVGAEVLCDRYIYFYLMNGDMFVLDLKNEDMKMLGESGFVNGYLIKTGDNVLSGIKDGKLITYTFPTN